MKYDALKELHAVMDKYNLKFLVLQDYSLDIQWEVGDEYHEINRYDGDLRCGPLGFWIKDLESKDN